MALIFLESGDDRTANWVKTGTNAADPYASGRTGYCFRHSASGSSSGILTYMIPAIHQSTTLAVGFAYRPVAGNTGPFLYFKGDNATTTHISLDGESTGLQVARGDRSFNLGPRSGTYVADAWQYIELIVFMDGSVGTVVLRQNGATLQNLTNQNTKNGGTVAKFDSVEFGTYTSSGSKDFDDIWIATGSDPGLGDVQVYNLLPSGDAAGQQWTPYGGANYTNVNEAGAPITTNSYVSTSTAGLRDKYTLPDLTGGPYTIKGVCVSAYAGTDVGSASLKTLINDGTNTVTSTSTYPLTSTPVSCNTVYANAPDGGSWTTAKVNSLLIGVESA